MRIVGVYPSSRTYCAALLDVTTERFVDVTSCELDAMCQWLLEHMESDGTTHVLAIARVPRTVVNYSARVFGSGVLAAMVPSDRLLVVPISCIMLHWTGYAGAKWKIVHPVIQRRFPSPGVNFSDQQYLAAATAGFVLEASALHGFSVLRFYYGTYLEE